MHEYNLGEVICLKYVFSASTISMILTVEVVVMFVVTNDFSLKWQHGVF